MKSLARVDLCDDAARADCASVFEARVSIVRVRLSRAAAGVVEKPPGNQLPKVVVRADVVISIASTRQLPGS